jgi:hypothetical protein
MILHGHNPPACKPRLQPAAFFRLLIISRVGRWNPCPGSAHGGSGLTGKFDEKIESSFSDLPVGQFADAGVQQCPAPFSKIF